MMLRCSRRLQPRRALRGLGEYGWAIRVWAYLPDDLIARAFAVMPRNLTRAEWNLYIRDALPYQAVCENLPLEP
jgi:hypothetical protein